MTHRFLFFRFWLEEFLVVLFLIFLLVLLSLSLSHMGELKAEDRLLAGGLAWGFWRRFAGEVLEEEAVGRVIVLDFFFA